MAKNKKTATTKTQKITDVEIKGIIDEVLKTVGVQGETEVVVGEENIEVILNTEDSGIVIGYHGEVLESLQIVLSAIVSKKVGKFMRVSLEVGEYKKKRVEWLENLASETKRRSLEEQREVALSGLKPWERRIVHLFLQEDKEVTSESVGEGRERTLIIKPK